jgi:hypothetical protein
MSKARQKGTAWESELLPKLRDLFGQQVERAPLRGVNDKGDFVGVPWLHEAKHVAVPRFQEWARTAAKKDDDWVVIWKGDARKSGHGPYVLMPLHLYEALVSRDQSGRTLE